MNYYLEGSEQNIVSEWEIMTLDLGQARISSCGFGCRLLGHIFFTPNIIFKYHLFIFKHH